MRRETHLDDSFSYQTFPSASEKPLQVKRRQFLQTAGLASVALALSPKLVFGQSEAMRWRDRVTGFVYTICDNEGRARRISGELYRATIYLAPRATDFHFYYAAPYIFVGAEISPEEVICGNGFEVNRFPYYDVQCPCRGINDLNAFEIRRISNGKEIEYYGCVLAPYGRRNPLQYADHADYRRTMRSYGLNPEEFTPEYKRVFTGKGRGYPGYQVAHRTETGSNGLPKRDVLLSSENI